MGCEVVRWSSARARGPVTMVALGRPDLDVLSRTDAAAGEQAPEEAGRDHREAAPAARGGAVSRSTRRGAERWRREQAPPARLRSSSSRSERSRARFSWRYLLWGIRSLILPVVVGGLLAYICGPVVVGLERYRVTRGLAIGLLLLAFASAAFVIVSVVRAGVPTEIGALDFKTRALHKVNDRYRTPDGPRCLAAREPALPARSGRRGSGDGSGQPASRHDGGGARAISRGAHARRARRRPPTTLLVYDRSNLQTLEQRGLRTGGERPDGIRSGRVRRGGRTKTPLAALAAILSTWVVAPTVFLFLLRDTGEIKRGFLSLVPNRLFEPTLAVLADLDGALGGYLRGVFLECCAPRPRRWRCSSRSSAFRSCGRVVLGFLAGATNVIPYVGSAVALLLGLAYTLLADQIHPLLPMINADNVAIWLVVGVLLIELLKNVVVEPARPRRRRQAPPARRGHRGSRRRDPVRPPGLAAGDPDDHDREGLRLERVHTAEGVRVGLKAMGRAMTKTKCVTPCG